MKEILVSIIENFDFATLFAGLIGLLLINQNIRIHKNEIAINKLSGSLENQLLYAVSNLYSQTFSQDEIKNMKNIHSDLSDINDNETINLYIMYYKYIEPLSRVVFSYGSKESIRIFTEMKQISKDNNLFDKKSFLVYGCLLACQLKYDCNNEKISVSYPFLCYLPDYEENEEELKEMANVAIQKLKLPNYLIWR